MMSSPDIQYALFCAVCNINFLSEIDRSNHMNSKKHRKNVSKSASSQSTSVSAPIEASSTIASVMPPVAPSSDEGCERSSPVVPTTSSGSRSFSPITPTDRTYAEQADDSETVAEHAEACMMGLPDIDAESSAKPFTADRSDASKLYCEACNVVVHDKKSYEVHMASRKHHELVEVFPRGIRAGITDMAYSCKVFLLPHGAAELISQFEYRVRPSEEEARAQYLDSISAYSSQKEIDDAMIAFDSLRNGILKRHITSQIDQLIEAIRYRTIRDVIPDVDDYDSDLGEFRDSYDDFPDPDFDSY